MWDGGGRERDTLAYSYVCVNLVTMVWLFVGIQYMLFVRVCVRVDIVFLSVYQNIKM